LSPEMGLGAFASGIVFKGPVGKGCRRNTRLDLESMNQMISIIKPYFCRIMYIMSMIYNRMWAVLGFKLNDTARMTLPE
jgi:hypothetical protein